MCHIPSFIRALDGEYMGIPLATFFSNLKCGINIIVIPFSTGADDQEEYILREQALERKDGILYHSCLVIDGEYENEFLIGKLFWMYVFLLAF